MKEIIVRWLKLSSEKFYATISWDGYIDENDKFVWGSDGEVLIQRDRLEWLFKIKHYFRIYQFTKIFALALRKIPIKSR